MFRALLVILVLLFTSSFANAQYIHERVETFHSVPFVVTQSPFVTLGQPNFVFAANGTYLAVPGNPVIINERERSFAGEAVGFERDIFNRRVERDRFGNFVRERRIRR